MTDPLILTALLDDVSFARFQGDRQAHYPPSLNRVPAHLTLFHNLPGDELAAIGDTLKTACAALDPLTLAVTGIRFLGRGCAYTIDCPALSALYKTLAATWENWLIPQDRQPFRPHIVIQNKTEPVAAKALYDDLSKQFQLFNAEMTGLTLWHYRGGPWESAGAFGFAAPTPPLL